MDNIQVVMPMAGRGQRFRDDGFNTPKPFILVDGRPMFLKAIGSLSLLQGKFDLFFIIRKDANEAYGVEEQLKKYFPSAFVCIIDKETRGAAETVLALQGSLKVNSPILILDADLEFDGAKFFRRIFSKKGYAFDGHLIHFSSSDSRYSYVKTRKKRAVEVAEKKVISDKALIGAYFWNLTSDFFTYANRVIEDGISDKQKEFYISNVIQAAIQNGLQFSVTKTTFTSFGTPEELRDYLNRIDK